MTKKDYSKYFIKPSIKDARKRKSEDTVVIDFNAHFNLRGFGKGKTYKIETFGCQANEADSEKIRGILEALEFTQSESSLEGWGTGVTPTFNFKIDHPVRIGKKATVFTVWSDGYIQIGS